MSYGYGQSFLFVLMANLAGALTIGGILARTSVFSPEIRNVFGAISAETVGLPFGQALLRGIFAGWLLALLVWLLPFAEHARFFVIIALTWMISVCGFTHVVAGSVEAFYLASSGLVSWGGALGHIAPVLIGNMIGGVSLVTALNHAQVVS
jgi:formate/nitrite transporter FocA (FNT family)